MDKEFALAMIATVAVVGGIVFLAISLDEKEEHWLAAHNCEVIHQNPDYTVLQYEPASKTLMPITYKGKKFYKCDNGEWH